MKGMQGAVTDASGSTQWTYDNRYRTTQEQKTIGSRHATTTFGYNSYQVNRITYPDGQQAAYTFTKGAEPKTLTAAGQQIVADAAYNERGSLTRLSFDPQQTRRTEYGYYDASQNFRLKTIRVRGATPEPLMWRKYEYDTIGNITKIDDLQENRYDQALTYDALSRLTEQSNSNFPGGSEQFEYSANGNLLHKNGRDYTYWPGTHQVRREGLHRYTYDDNGNLQTKETLNDKGEVIQTQTYNYDADNRLVSLSSGERYDYDFSGRRVKKTEHGATAYYFN